MDSLAGGISGTESTALGFDYSSTVGRVSEPPTFDQWCHVHGRTSQWS